MGETGTPTARLMHSGEQTPGENPTDPLTSAIINAKTSMRAMRAGQVYTKAQTKSQNS